MTTRVTVEVEQTNCGTGKMLVGVAGNGAFSAVVVKPPFKQEFWVHGENRVVCREASEQDVQDRV